MNVAVPAGIVVASAAIHMVIPPSMYRMHVHALIAGGAAAGISANRKSKIWYVAGVTGVAAALVLHRSKASRLLMGAIPPLVGLVL